MRDKQKKYQTILDWRRRNPDKVSEYNKRAYERHHISQSGTFRVKPGSKREKVYRHLIFQRDQGICGICKNPVDPNNWHADHIIPLSQGGDHSYTNVQVSHPMCNYKKGAKSLIRKMM